MHIHHSCTRIKNLWNAYLVLNTLRFFYLPLLSNLLQHTRNVKKGKFLSFSPTNKFYLPWNCIQLSERTRHSPSVYSAKVKRMHSILYTSSSLCWNFIRNSTRTVLLHPHFKIRSLKKCVLGRPLGIYISNKYKRESSWRMLDAT